MVTDVYNGLNYKLCLISFIIFLLPISYSGLGINYSFVFFPFIYLFFKKRFFRPSKLIIPLILFYFLIFCFSAFYQVNFFPRRLTSFLIFVSIFAFSFVKIGKNEILAFKKSIILVSCYLAIKSIYLLISAGPDIGFLGKSLVGSQRIGFLYITSFFLVFVDFKKSNYSFILKSSVITLMLVGILLTFNRSSIIAFLIVFLFYLLSYSKNRIKNFFSINLILLIFGSLFFYLFTYYFGSGVIEFFLIRLNPDYIYNSALDNASSTSIRIEIWKSIIEYVKSNPIMGSGFLGPWVLTTVPENSAHSQYFDIFFRTGFLGFMFWSLLTLKIILKLSKIDKALFCGFLSIIIFGFFNETFKLSYGAFIYAFCLAYTFQYTNLNKLNSYLYGKKHS